MMLTQEITALLSVVILIMSVVIHEVAHGFAADSLGDPTARLSGRLTLNPFPHLDIIGSVIVPILFFSFGGFIFGWAKPVPYNPYNIPNKYGSALVAAAGPASNLFLALVFGLLVRLGPSLGLPPLFVEFSLLIVLINVILAIFNLVPIPPLDGSKILFNFLPYKYRYIQDFLERNGFLIVIVFVFFLWELIFPIINLVFTLFTGLSTF